MANHVRTTVEVEGVNKETLAQVKEWFAFMKGTRIGKDLFGVEMDEGSSWGDKRYNVHNLFADGVAEWDWYTNNVGAKWCHFEEVSFSDDSFYFELQSAWSYPEPLIERINRQLTNLQAEGTKMFITYEDEMPNFVGAQVWEDDVMVDGFECDDEELTEEIRESNPRYGELYDKYMEDELTEEEEEEYNDLRWETQGDVIWNLNSNLFEAWR